MDTSSFDLHIVKNFFDVGTCRDLIVEMRHSATTAALTHGKGDAAVDETVRGVRQVSISPESASFVARRLEGERESIAEHFGIELVTFEEPQFLCYRTGDFFVAHQDGNTGLIQLETDRTRRVSISIFLNNQSSLAAEETFVGGALVFSDWRTGSRREVASEAGMLIAFRSETIHKVTPITHGQRYAIVSWYGKC